MSHSYQSVDVLESGGRSYEVRGEEKRSTFLTILGVVGVVLLVGLVAFASKASTIQQSSAVATPTTEQIEISATSAATTTPVAELTTELDEKDEKKEKKLIKLSIDAKKSAPPEPVAHDSVCMDPNYTKVTLKTANEMTMVALFDNLHGEKKFEASDVIPVGHHYLVVFDNLYRIGRIDEQLQFHSPEHELIPSSPSRSGDSGFESIVYDEPSNTYFVVVEAELTEADGFHRASLDSNDAPITGEEKDKKALESQPKEQQDEFHAWIEEISMPEEEQHKEKESSSTDDSKQKGYVIKDRCRSQFKFISGNKGFEGAAHVRVNNEIVFLGLCEGNFCEGGKRGRTVGNGRIVLMRKREAEGDKECEWETVNLLALPSLAAFADYSAIAILPLSDKVKNKHGNLYHLAVTSQESSQVWIGELRVTETSDAKDWSLTDGIVYNFPRTNSCEIEYCNIEGISFVDDNILVAVSDKMKGGARQHYRCLQKDQSIHTFVLP